MSDENPDASVGLRRRFPDMHPEDWTIPPEMPVYIDAEPPLSRRESVLDGLRTSRLFASVAMGLTLVTIAWWAWNGRPPASDPRFGIPMLVLHIGGIYTASRSLQASSEAWRLAAVLPDEQQPDVDSLERTALTLGCDAILCMHAAMVLAAILF